MPGWKVHVIFSLFLVIAWMSAFYYLDIPSGVRETAATVFFIVASSLFPDIDMKKSKVRDIFSLAIALSVSISYIIYSTSTWYYGPVYFILLYYILRYLPTKHRGITHKFWFSILFSTVLSFSYLSLGQFTIQEFLLWFSVIFTGYGLHLLIDRHA